MAENAKLDLDSATLTSSCEVRGLEDMDTQKISVISDYKSEKTDSFVVDIESFSHGTDRERNANSRIMLQKSFSRKGYQRGGEKKTNSTSTASERDVIAANSSPKAALVGSSTPEMPTAVVVRATDYPSNNPQVHHITITTGNIGTTAESRWVKRNSFRRAPPSWAIDPRKVFLFFATLSSMGTLLLIYFTLLINNVNADENIIDWQQ